MKGLSRATSNISTNCQKIVTNKRIACLYNDNRPISGRNNEFFYQWKSLVLALSTVEEDKIMEDIPEFDSLMSAMDRGHNGLVAAAYFQKSGFRTCVLEKRHVVGGAAVTEEIVPGFKFSRASYLLSLLRPHIYSDLELKKHGLKTYKRNPSSYTPLQESAWQQNGPRSLTLGSDELSNKRQIAKFSQKDAQAYRQYEEKLKRVVAAVEPLLDLSAADTVAFLRAESVWSKVSALLNSPHLRKAVMSVMSLGADIPALYEFLTAPASSILNHWFESEPLKGTLMTDAVIGTMTGPDTPGNGYVLLHHMMGESGWAYPEGGMGAVTQAMAAAAASYGAHIFTDVEVSSICLNGEGHAIGVVTSEGHEIKATIVLSNATPYVTFNKLLPQTALPEKYQAAINNINYASPVTKINVAVNKLPNFLADPCEKANQPMPLHQCTIHINCENTELITQAYNCALNGKISDRPMIEMVIPSSVDLTLAPPGCHVCLLFTQFTPYHLKNGATWDKKTKEQYAKQVFANIEEYTPGFTDSIVGMEVLTPPDLENIFGLTGGNIFHGALTMDQLFLSRPIAGDIGPPSPFTPINKLLLCGSGIHPGGGVMGAPGCIAAQAGITLLQSMGRKNGH